jgi:hypothetical protein
MKAILMTFCTFFLLAAFGQDQKAMEKALPGQFKKIGYWAEYKGNNPRQYDSLEIANKHFREVLLKYTSRYPSTISFGFKDLEKEGLTIATSADGMFRVYSWDTWTGGTMHYFDNVYQYKAAGKVYSKAIEDANNEGDPGYWYSAIYSLANGGKTYYLGVRHASYSTKE